VRLVLDEHLDRAIAVELRRRGADVIAVTEDASLVGLDDAELLAWAADAGRVIVTYDARGFAPLAEVREVRQEPFAGLIFLSARRYPQGEQSYGELVRDLARVLAANPAPEAFRDRSRWLGSD